MKTIDDIKKIAVIGAGLMGRQIALLIAMHGYDVSLTDSMEQVLMESALPWKDEYLAQRVEKGKITEEEKDAADSKLKFESGLYEAVADADIVIEAVVEDKDVKRALFAQLSGLVEPDTILATNSSYMVSSMFADVVKNPERLANYHFFNPALVMKLVEVVQGPHTSENTAKVLMQFADRIGKKPAWVRKEIDGFIANRILRVVNFEAFSLLEKGIASFEDIDIAVENGLNYPMGPFKLQDLTGIDLAYHAALRILEETGVKRPGFDIIKQKYEAGEYGRKSGKGFYDYTKK